MENLAPQVTCLLAHNADHTNAARCHLTGVLLAAFDATDATDAAVGYVRRECPREV